MLRYERNGVWWWIHDTLVHPITGTIGLFGRLCRSPRIMAMAHHIHNATAPSNDSWADYAEAAHRAGCNETPNNPSGRMTPDEQEWVSEKHRSVFGEECVEPSLAVERLRRVGLAAWTTQASGGKPPEIEDAQRTNAAEERLARVLRALDSLPQHALHQIRKDLISSGAIRPEDWPSAKP